jgi:BMFP domain-containing protein YqiC
MWSFLTSTRSKLNALHARLADLEQITVALNDEIAFLRARVTGTTRPLAASKFKPAVWPLPKSGDPSP